MPTAPFIFLIGSLNKQKTVLTDQIITLHDKSRHAKVSIFCYTY
ncbi:hypothetical protein STRDD13_00640 [Streptococcus sp. DD13]|nr:hypothetical protein STRDD13_00640 [Streptococcus sp. DD13]